MGSGQSDEVFIISFKGQSRTVSPSQRHTSEHEQVHFWLFNDLNATELRKLLVRLLRTGINDGCFTQVYDLNSHKHLETLNGK